MERPLDVIAYLLAKTVATAENKPVDAVIAEALEATKKTSDKKPQEADDEAVERVYSSYPTKCPISGRSTGKCSKNKKQISTLLKARGEKDMIDTINTYVAECVSSKTYIKNFSTLLNQFPENKPEAPAQQPKRDVGGDEIWSDPLYKQWRDRHKET